MQIPPFLAKLNWKGTHSKERLPFQSIRNIRDFRGMCNKDGQQVRKGLFIRSAVLSDITQEDVRILEEDYHLCSIIDLRMERELEEQPDAAIMGAGYHHIPLLRERTVGITHEEDAEKELAEAVRIETEELEKLSENPENPGSETVLEEPEGREEPGRQEEPGQQEEPEETREQEKTDNGLVIIDLEAEIEDIIQVTAEKSENPEGTDGKTDEINEAPEEKAEGTAEVTTNPVEEAEEEPAEREYGEQKDNLRTEKKEEDCEEEDSEEENRKEEDSEEENREEENRKEENREEENPEEKETAEQAAGRKSGPRMPQMKILYRNMAKSEYTTAQLKKVFAEICDVPKTGAVLWHCTEGKDRCGIVSALFLYLLDFDMEQILYDYLLTNKAAQLRALKNGGITLLATGSWAQAEAIRKAYMADESYLREYWDTITEQYGSVDNFLRDGLEITDEMKQRLKEYCLMPEL